MSVINKIYDDTKINIIKDGNEIWFKAKSVAEILGYTNPQKAIRNHVFPENRKKLSDLKVNEMGTLEKNTKDTIYIDEPGVYQLIFGSKLKSAKDFQRWVFKEVLPSIRKTGSYSMNHKVKPNLTFEIKNETDLHVKVVAYVKRWFENSLFVASLGENQDTSYKRIDSYKKGYLKGSPDLIINNYHKKYRGFAIEFKTPKGNGILSESQKKMLRQYKLNDYKVLVSNDYDEIVQELIEYFRDVRIICRCCGQKFKTPTTITAHKTGMNHY
jgi:prophage antirepressor-like protein